MRALRLTLLAAASVILFAGAFVAPVAHAVPTTALQLPVPGEPGNPCESGPSTERSPSPLCPFGPASCIAVGLYADVAGLTTQLARSTADAFAFANPTNTPNDFGSGFSRSDAHTARADMPPALGAGAIESSCFASAYADSFGNIFSSAYGTADVTQLFLDLSAYSGPVTLYADALREQGASFPLCSPPASFNCADVADLEVYNPLPSSNYRDVPANTMIPLPPLGALFLNEQFAPVVHPNCVEHDGDAARLVLGPVTVIVSWVATCGTASGGAG